jgi:uncharacterized protein
MDREITNEIEDREITWKVLDIPVYGTITTPKDNDPHPSVVFLAGSGPTDRNWCSPLIPGTNGTAKILAEKLAERGYVTLRYDKLGSGPRVKENLSKFAGKLSMQIFMEELSVGVESLVSERNVDCSSIFALSNSEGAIHAMNYQLHAKENRFKGFILTGAPGRAVREVARTQLLEQSKSFHNADILMKRYGAAIADFMAARPIEIDSSLPKGMELLLRSLESPTNLPFSRELWSYSLSAHVSKITNPILVIIGKKDIQVDWRLDGKLLEDAIVHNVQSRFNYPQDANHLLKYEEMPREKLTREYVAAHYNAHDARLDGEAANFIFTWLAEQTKQVTK